VSPCRARYTAEKAPTEEVLQSPHYHVIGKWYKEDPSLLWRLIQDPHALVTMSMNMWPGILDDTTVTDQLDVMTPEDLFPPQERATYYGNATTVIRKIKADCNGSPLCGAALIHKQDSLARGIVSAARLAQSLTMLPERNYTILHIRAGGSSIKIR